ncbi:hypothetical protein B0T20DRAFT_346073 [Sordaria brevicollis]|uniref:Uncharacterized protein n=1 Tax=Sordaria brevicollis TaxID=83679 RepID=A0AAE0PKY7_SORBR|nr:hypothetical protein B0T20DRAFT_346073 [Sordaria brevicollis]
MTPKTRAKRSSTPQTRTEVTKPFATPRSTPTAKKTTKSASSPNTAIAMIAPKRKPIRHHACRLHPPCRKGHGGPARTILPIGKYFFSEEALIHDLAALKRGAVYHGEAEFFKRVKAWYKAEVDRLMHRKQVDDEIKKDSDGKKLDELMIRPSLAITKSATTTVIASQDIDSSASSPTSETSRNSVSSESEYSDFEDDHLKKIKTLRATTPIRKNAGLIQTPSPTPARVQPSRAAKRKADTPALPPTPAKTPSPKRRKVTLLIKSSNPEPKTEQPEVIQETKGDYTLSQLDFEEHQPDYSDRGPMADGLDVANFMINLEKAVDNAVSELVASRLGNGVLSLSSPRTSKQGIRARWRRVQSISYPRGHLSGIAVHESKDKKEEEAEVFEPAGDAVPGEDWRPLKPPLSPIEKPKKGMNKKGLELRLVSREGTPAPEAEMQISPTLGRWQLADRRGSVSLVGRGRNEPLKAGNGMALKVEVDSDDLAVKKEAGHGLGLMESPIEESNRKSVQVSGLRFDVELFSKLDQLFAALARSNKEHCDSERYG